MDLKTQRAVRDQKTGREPCKCCGDFYPVLEFAEHSHLCGKCRLTGTPVSDEIFIDVPFEQYLQWNLPSQSVLKEGRESEGTMAHVRAAMDGQRVKEPTDDMVLGDALHVALLDPARMVDHVVRWDGGTRRGKDWDAFRVEHKGKAILTVNQHEKLEAMVKALRRHPEVRKWIGRCEHTEVSAIGVVDGVRVKARCDALTPSKSDPLVDLKKVTNTNPRTVTAAVMEFGYHIQSYIYRKLFDRDGFRLACVEGTAPFDVVVYELTPEFLEAGEEEASQLLQRFKHCQETGVWPGRSDSVEPLEPPSWAIGRGFTINGEAA